MGDRLELKIGSSEPIFMVLIPILVNKNIISTGNYQYSVDNAIFCINSFVNLTLNHLPEKT